MPRKIEKVALYSGELPKALFWKRGSRKDDEPSSFRALSPGQIPDMRMLKNIRGERFYLGTITLGLSDSESSSDESSSFSSHRLPCQLPVATRGRPQMNHGKINELEHLVEDLRKTIRELQLKNISLSNLVEKLQHVETRKKAEIKNLKMEVSLRGVMSPRPPASSGQSRGSLLRWTAVTQRVLDTDSYQDRG
ncbi:uncharacterized protein LOC124481861 isoform X2 [Hypomesus transpacificus]|uniref:uncharacterized protein LOC124481652 isoform X5 n=1 Tax=Hypomesus transpacificus TaxID=137520 RepID=UPI001F07835F|nr:uncharacterized protein LOC124481652 isoform X5 [Hypomesus transpacificus]XP_046898078.1 uncharacterized protein LOC124481861 isoform X2 [Hypomesus transpacificus]